MRLKGYDVRYLDTSVRPQDDFYQYAIGGWLKNNPIPPEKTRWGTFNVLRENVLEQLHRIIKEIIKNGHVDTHVAVGDTEHAQLRDFFQSGLNTKERNRRGVEPIRPILNEIAKVQNRKDLYEVIKKIHESFSPFFGIGVGIDDKDSTKYITCISQGGLSLGEKEHYLSKDAHDRELREKFVAYIATMLIHSGLSKKEAYEAAVRILAFETSLAKVSMDATDRRDITKVYNKLSRSGLKKLAPHIPWDGILESVSIQGAKEFLVYQKEFMSALDAILEQTPIETIKEYLVFNIIDSVAPYLSTQLEKESFDFYGKIFTGTEKQEPLWKRVLATVNSGIGDLLGKEYVRRHFSEDTKKIADEMVLDILAAFEMRVRSLDWMTSATKKKALKKLSLMSHKIGYPKKWRTYAGLHIDSADYVGNVLRASRYETLRVNERLGKPVDRDEWYMYPHTVNAYYSPNLNDIVFPAAILQPPFFDAKGDAAFNYGAMGAVIAHEVTHGFDDQGCYFDGKGNYKKWWTDDDKKAFDDRAHVLVKQFNAYTIYGKKVNGKLTLGENIADLGGLVVAYDAYMMHLKRTGAYEDVGGFTPEQRFFLGAALFECGHMRKEMALRLLVSDPHSPSSLRVNGPFSNMEEFHKAFAVKKGDALYRTPKQCARIW